MKKELEAHDGALGKGAALNIGEIGDPGPIERVSETNFVEQAELESFMNELVTIVVSPAVEDGAYDVISPNVNGLNQPIIRGQKTAIKRKYVEALARCRLIRYDQYTPDPRNPEAIQMVERPALAYPFNVVDDHNPKGFAWLQAILAER